MITTILAACVIGTRAHLVTVAAEPAPRGFDIVGLPDAAAREVRIRVRTALAQSELDHPPGNTVRVEPPQRRGTSLDLAIAVAACGPAAPCRDTLFLGELSLAGGLRPVRGLIPSLLEARREGISNAIVPSCQLAEARLVDGIETYGAASLAEVVDFVTARASLPRARDTAGPPYSAHDLAPVMGLDEAKRALRVAAAGAHSTLLIGRFGSGKTMLARRVPQWMEELSAEQAVEVATTHSAAGLEVRVPIRRPFRAPHRTASSAALLGGGDPVRPGEVTLAHHGVLLLDDAAEFARGLVDDVLRAASRGYVSIHRRGEVIAMPTRALVIGAMAPCPCGHRGDPQRQCACTTEQIAALFARVPLDRFDIVVSLDGAEPPHRGVEPLRVHRLAATIASLGQRHRPTTADLHEAERLALS